MDVNYGFVVLNDCYWGNARPSQNGTFQSLASDADDQIKSALLQRRKAYS